MSPSPCPRVLPALSSGSLSLGGTSAPRRGQGWGPASGSILTLSPGPCLSDSWGLGRGGAPLSPSHGVSPSGSAPRNPSHGDNYGSVGSNWKLRGQKKMQSSQFWSV